jgi:sugar lactone lactonase YvrE
MTTVARLFALALSWNCCTLLLAAGVIDTVAGTGKPEDNGPAGVATAVNIGDPFGVEWGPDGALYICEVRHHRVRRLDLASGELTTVAGSGKKGYSGDGGLATAAALNEPYEVRFDTAGNMYFVEMKNHLVRKVERATGLISTVAGTGQEGFSGDGGPATAATFRQPHSIALDAANNLYIADILNHRIRKVDSRTGRVETIAGTGAKQMPVDQGPAAGQPVLGPRSLFVSGDDLWVCLREGNSVWKLQLTKNRWEHVAGTGKAGYSGDGGPAKTATFRGPKGLALGTAGQQLYVVDTENQMIRQIDLATGTIHATAGSPQNTLKTAQLGDGGPATKATLVRPHGVCVSPSGTVFIGDTELHRVRRVQPITP